MKIAHVVDYFHTDVGYQEYYLALQQGRAGHQVQVITSTDRHHALGEETADARFGASLLTDADVDLVRLPSRALGHDRLVLHGLHGALAEFAPDAVHCHHSFAPTTVAVARSCRALGTALLVDNHIQERIAPGSMSVAGRAWYGGFRAVFGARLRAQVGTWVANGPDEASFLETRMGLGTGGAVLVPLGFDAALFGWEATRRRDMRTERGWDDDTVIAVTGKLHAGKRVDLVAAACERTMASRPVRLVLAGTAEPGVVDAVFATAPELARAGRIEQLGLLGRADLGDLYHAADAVVFGRLPSISVYEAAGTGVPVLVGDHDFATWLHGLHPDVRPVDVEQLDLGAVTPRTDGERHAAAEAAVAAFGWEGIADRFVDLYQAVPAHPTVPGALAGT